MNVETQARVGRERFPHPTVPVIVTSLLPYSAGWSPRRGGWRWRLLGLPPGSPARRKGPLGEKKTHITGIAPELAFQGIAWLGLKPVPIALLNQTTQIPSTHWKTRDT